jgi:hypothetical protein
MFNESEFAKITDKEKKDSFFIINRRLAIGFPSQAFKMSKNKINLIYAIDSWFLITKRFKKKP